MNSSSLPPRGTPIDDELIANSTSLERVKNWESLTSSGPNSSEFVGKQKGQSRQHWQKISSKSVMKFAQTKNSLTACVVFDFQKQKIQESEEIFEHFKSKLLKTMLF